MSFGVNRLKCGRKNDADRNVATLGRQFWEERDTKTGNRVLLQCISKGVGENPGYQVACGRRKRTGKNKGIKQ